jgi:TatA/E family protein of Tat protein translocase
VLGIGAPELIFILLLALLIFGPKRLPEIGRTVGRALGEFRRASSELKRSLENEIRIDDEHAPPRPLLRPAPVSPAQPVEAAAPTPPAETPAAEPASPPPPTQPE